MSVTMPPRFRILALNAYHGGSHRAFLDGWKRHSGHDLTVLALPAFKWKWRMRHAAIHFAEEVAELTASGQRWDAVFCTDMLNLAEFRGLAPAAVSSLPAVAYFHENQLTYPSPESRERDLHFAFTNMLTRLAADQVWFNSAFHRDEFLAALAPMLRRMPDHQPLSSVARIRAKSRIFSPGIELPPPRPPRLQGAPLRVTWASRWEHDKDPEIFFSALRILRARNISFQVNVLGESFGQVPSCFEDARKELADHIGQWGFLQDRDEYQAVLTQSDVFVSTAGHEFFGIAMVEGVAAGCYPLAPRRLAYPEVLGPDSRWFFDGSVAHLAARLTEFAEQIETRGQLWTDEDRRREMVRRFGWPTIASAMDNAVAALCTTGG